MEDNQSITILDGGMSRELMRINAPFRQPEWSAFALMEGPQYVQQVHREFAFAGADVLTTNSYALVPFHIGEEQFQAHGEELAALAGRLTRAAANEEFQRSGRKILVAGSLPPIFGSYKPEFFDGTRVQDYLAVLIRALTPYVDIWLGETLSLIAEAEAVRTALKGSSKPFWIAFTIDDREEMPNAQLRSTEPVPEAARWALNSGATGLLFNCSRPEFMTAALRDTQAVFKEQGRTIPIGVYANAFEPKPESYAANKDVAPTRKDLDMDSYVSFARQWVANGATIIGGCCGIGREHIQQLAQAFTRKG